MPQKTFDFRDRNTGKMYSMPWESDDPPPEQLMEQYIKEADGPPVVEKMGGVNPLTIAGSIGDTAGTFGKQFYEAGKQALPGLVQGVVAAKKSQLGAPSEMMHLADQQARQYDDNIRRAREIGGFEGGARRVAAPFDLLGIPVTGTADAIIDRNYGGAAFQGAMVGAGAYGAAKGATGTARYARQALRKGGDWGRARMYGGEPIESRSSPLSPYELPPHVEPQPRYAGRGATDRARYNRSDSTYAAPEAGPATDLRTINVEDTTPVPFTAPPVEPLVMNRQLTGVSGDPFVAPSARPPYEFAEPDTIVPETPGTRFYQGEAGIADSMIPYRGDRGPTNIRKSQMELEPVMDDKGEITGINAIGGHEITPQVEGFIPGREGYQPATGQNATMLPQDFGELAPVPPMMAAQGGVALGQPITPIQGSSLNSPPMANRGERLSQTELLNAELIKRQIAERRASRMPVVPPIAPPVATMPPVAPVGVQPVVPQKGKRDSWVEKDPNTELVTKEEIKQQFGVPTKVAVEKGWAVLTKKGFAITKQGSVVLNNIRKMAEDESNKPQMSRAFSPLIGADNRKSFADGIKEATDEQLKDYHSQLTEDLRKSEENLTRDPGNLNRHVEGVQKRRPIFDRKKIEQIEAEQDRRRIAKGDTEADPNDPQMARSIRDGKRGIQIGQNIKRAAKELTTGYTQPLEEIMVREGMQNAIDIVKAMGTGGKIDVELHDDNLVITDNGRGMTIEELETVFSNLNESGKTNDPNSTGGKGIGKATYMLGGDYFEGTTVSIITDENGEQQKIKYTIKGTGDELMEHADIDEEIVPWETPTGTKIKTKFSPNQSYYSARDMLDKITRYSRGISTEVTANYYGTARPKPFQTGKGDRIIGQENIAGNDVKIVVPETVTLHEADYIPVYYLNNGMYQFRKFHHLPEKLSDIPDELIVEVNPTAEEGTAEYPFPTQRESLKDPIQERITEIIKDVLINPHTAKKKARTQELYDSMPIVAAKNTIRKTVLFDPGERLTTTELNYVQNSRVMTEMIALFDKVIDDIIVNVGDAKLANRLEGIGIVFGPGMHGIHIPNPSTGKSTILINPFIAIDDALRAPYDSAHFIIGTNLHEAAHIGTETKGDMVISSADLADYRIGKHLQAYLNEVIEAGADQGHTTPFLKRLGDIYAKYGPEQTFHAVERLTDILTDRSGGYRPEVQELLRIYTESRGRAETKEDILSRTGEKSSDKGDGGKKDLSGDAGGSGGGVVGPIEKKPIKFGPTTDDFERARAEGIYPQGLTSEQKGKFLSTRIKPFIDKKQRALPPVPNYVSPLNAPGALEKGGIGDVKAFLKPGEPVVQNTGGPKTMADEALEAAEMMERSGDIEGAARQREVVARLLKQEGSPVQSREVSNIVPRKKSPADIEGKITNIEDWKRNATPEQRKQVKTEVDNLIKEIDEALKEIPDLPENPDEPQFSRVRQDPRKRSVSLKIGMDEPSRRIKVEYSKKKQALLEIGNFSRSMVSSMDFSAAFRQASPMIASPQFWTNMGPMIASFFSEGYYNKMAKAIEDHPDFPFAMSAKVPFTDMDHLSTREERYKSEWAERITSGDVFSDEMKKKFPILGSKWTHLPRRHSYVRMSGRAYTGYLNAVRMATFVKLLDHAKKQGNDLRANVSKAETDPNLTNKDLQTALKPMKELANVVGDVTGRSNFGKALEPTAEILNIIIFSPRLAWSRMKLLNPYTYVNPNISWTARQQYLKSLASLATVGLIMYAASKATGGDPELDLESVDFGKTRFGANSRAEMVPGGFAPYVRMMYMLPRIIAHTATKGEWPDVGKVSPITGRRTRLNSGDFGAPTGLSETYGFVEKKEAPNASLVTDFLRGTDFMGRELDITSMDPAYNPILGRVLPISGQDTREMITQEKPRYWPAMVPASLGWGVQTYGDQPFRRPNKGQPGRVRPIK